MNKIFRDLYYEPCNDINNTTPGFLAKAKGWANDAILEFCGIRDWMFLHQNYHHKVKAYEFLSGLPLNISNIIQCKIRDYSAPLSYKAVEDITRQDHDVSQTGTPNYYTLEGSGVLRQPSSILQFIAASPSDVGKTGKVYGYYSGRMIEETFTLAVTLTNTDNSYRFAYIEKIVLDEACSGDVSCYSHTSQLNVTIPAASLNTGSLTITQPSVQIRAISSSALDGSSFTLRLLGLDASYETEFSEGIALNGTSYSSYTSNYFRSVSGMAVESSSHTGVNGTLRVIGSDSTLIGIIQQGHKSCSFIQFGLYPIPTADTVVYLRYKYKMPMLVNDNDPLFPIPAEAFPLLKSIIRQKAYSNLGLGGNAAAEVQQNMLLLKQFKLFDNKMRADVDLVLDRTNEIGWAGATTV